MKMKCVVCGDSIGKVRFSGTRKDMTVIFCGRHLDDCRDCDVCTCQIDMKSF